MGKNKNPKDRNAGQRPLPKAGKVGGPPDPAPRAASGKEDKVDPDVAAALGVATLISETIEEEIPAWKVEKNREYFESTEEKAKSIAETIGRTNRVTPGQRMALDNMLAGILKWVD